MNRPMKAKPEMAIAGFALDVSLLSGGCADAGPVIARDAVAIPAVIGGSIIQGTVQGRAEQSEWEYRKTNPVTSFQDFDRRFTEPSVSPWHP